MEMTIHGACRPHPKRPPGALKDKTPYPVTKAENNLQVAATIQY